MGMRIVLKFYTYKKTKKGNPAIVGMEIHWGKMVHPTSKDEFLKITQLIRENLAEYLEKLNQAIGY
jgi:hypothetical protein